MHCRLKQYVRIYTVRLLILCFKTFSDDSASTGSLEESVSLEDESDSSRSVKQHNANDQPRSENMPVVVVTTASFHTKPSPHGRHLGKETQDQPAARKTEESKVENSWDR